MVTYFRGVLPALFFSVLCSTHLLQAQVPVRHKTEHVIFVMTDGLRWQEVFRRCRSFFDGQVRMAAYPTRPT